MKCHLLTSLLLISMCVGVAATPEFQVYGEKAQKLHLAGQYEEALQQINLSIAAKDQYCTSYFVRGRIYRSLGRNDEAEQDFLAASKMEGAEYMWYVWAGLQWVHSRHERHEQALEAAQAAVEAGPAEAGAYLSRARARWSLYNYEGASADYTKALSLKPKSAEIHHHRGQLQFQMGNHSKALRDFLTCFDLDPEHFDIHHDLAECYLYLGSLEKCDRSARKQLEIDRALLDPKTESKHRGSYRRMAVSYSFLGEDEDAIKFAEKAVAQNPESINSKFSLVYVLIGGGQYEESLPICDELQKSRPDSSYLYLMRAAAKRALGDGDGASKDLRKAAELNPQDKVVWRSGLTSP